MKELTKDESIEILEEFLDEDSFSDIVTETLVASHSQLGFCVYHQSKKSDSEVWQRFKVVIGGKEYFCTFGSQIKPLLISVFNEYG